MRVTADAGGIRAFGQELESAGGSISRKVGPVVKRGALNIKRKMTSDMRASKSFKGIAPTINFDFFDRPNAVEADIGPDKSIMGGAGSLANIAYFGTSRGGGTVDVMGGLRDEEPRFVKALEEVLGDAL